MASEYLGKLIVGLSNAIRYFDPESPVLLGFGDAQRMQSVRNGLRLVIGETMVIALKSFELRCSLGTSSA